MSLSLNYPAIQPSLNLDFANTDRLDPRVTFTRASPATYYDGVTTAKAEENLLTDSVNMLTTWTRGNINVTTGITAPDGTNTAIKIAATAVSGQHYIGSLANLPAGRALSIYARASERTVLQINQNTNSNTASFNLSTGVVASSTGGTASIVNAGGGWYRCIFISDDATRTSFTVWPDNTTGVYTGDGTSGLFIWAPQYEQRSAATAYTPTTTQPVTNYIPVLLTAAANVPRFEHNPVTGESLGLLIESARSNDVPASADFANAGIWSPINGTVTSNTVVAPDGTLTGDKLVANTVNAQHRIQISTAMTSGSTYTFSVYAKISDPNYTQIWMRTASDVVNVYFDLSTGTVGAIGGTGSAAISNAGNGWYRCSVTATAGSTGSLISRVNTLLNGAVDFIGNDWAGVFLWGAQIEGGTFATSYIATTGTAQTRQSDLASMTGTNFSSWYNNAEGTLYASYQVASNSQLRRILYLGNSVTSATYTNFISINAVSVSSAIFGEIYTGTEQATVNLGTNLVNATNQVALAYKTNDVYGIQNNTTGASDSSCVIPTVDRMFIGRLLDGTFLIGTIKKISYYPIRLTNAQLQNLTK